MDQNGFPMIPNGTKQTDQGFYIMAVNGSQIIESHGLKEGRRKKNSLDPFLHIAGDAVDPFTAGDLMQEDAVVYRKSVV